MVTKHAVGTIIEPPPQHADGAWQLHDTQVIAVMRDINDPPAPTELSKGELSKQRREWLLADVTRDPLDFVPVEHPVREMPPDDPPELPPANDDPSVPQPVVVVMPQPPKKYLDETVYATWYMV